MASALSEHRDILLKRIAVNEIPRSGKPDELLELYGINANAIVKAVKDIMGK